MPIDIMKQTDFEDFIKTQDNLIEYLSDELVKEEEIMEKVKLLGYYLLTTQPQDT